MQDNIIPHDHKVIRQDREQLLGQQGQLIWFTGLSGSGKSTLAGMLEEHLHSQGRATYLLDGDNLRTGLNNNLGFSAEDRTENIRRIGEVAKLFVDAGLIVIAAFVSPFEADRQQIKSLIPEGRFKLVYVKCSVEECERRDVKGLYAKARLGEISDFTGISSPYEEPENAGIVLDSEIKSLQKCFQDLTSKLALVQTIA